MPYTVLEFPTMTLCNVYFLNSIEFILPSTFPPFLQQIFIETVLCFSLCSNEWKQTKVYAIMELSILVQICHLLAVCRLNEITSLSGTSVLFFVHWRFHKCFHFSFLLFFSLINLRTFNCFLDHLFSPTIQYCKENNKDALFQWFTFGYIYIHVWLDHSFFNIINLFSPKIVAVVFPSWVPSSQWAVTQFLKYFLPL